jgi:rubrerythrin
MGELFDIGELVRIGVEDEKAGVAFYSALAGKARDAELRKVFANLAEQEKYHQKRFEQMLLDLGGHRQREEYPGQYMDYLRVLTGERAFPDPETAVRRADECPDDLAGLEMASRFERDTLLLMNEMRGLVPEKDKVIVDELAREEQSHLVTLAGARRRART